MPKQQIVIAGMTAAGAAVAAALIMPSEGLRLSAYRDPIGIVTDCWGHTATAQLGKTNTEAECIEKLRADMQSHWSGISKCAPGLSSAPPRVQGAVLSFAYNVGVAKACGSTLVRKADRGDFVGSCAEFTRWVWMGPYNCTLPEHQKRCGGLPKRRVLERAACEGGPVSLGIVG